MKSSLFTIFVITISIALFSVCAVSAADADNIDLGDSGFDSGLLMVDYSIQSNPQELGNKPIDTRDNGNYIQNMEDARACDIYYYDIHKTAEEIFSEYRYIYSEDARSDFEAFLANNSIQSNPQELGDSSFESDSGLLRMNVTMPTDPDLDAINSTSDDNISTIPINQKVYDKLFPKDPGFESDSRHKVNPQGHEDLKDKTTLTKIRDILKTLSRDDFKEIPPLDNSTAYNSWEEMCAALGQSSSNQ